MHFLIQRPMTMYAWVWRKEYGGNNDEQLVRVNSDRFCWVVVVTLHHNQANWPQTHPWSWKERDIAILHGMVVIGFYFPLDLNQRLLSFDLVIWHIESHWKSFKIMSPLSSFHLLGCTSVKVDWKYAKWWSHVNAILTSGTWTNFLMEGHARRQIHAKI